MESDEAATAAPRHRRRRVDASAAASYVSDDALRVAFRTPLVGAVCAALVSSAVQFLLVYDELRGVLQQRQQEEEEEQQQQKRRRKLMGGPRKKAAKCVDAAERLLDVALPALWEGRVRSVVLIFGASVFSPREVYVIDFARREPREEEESEGTSAPLAKEKVARLCAQKLIRALVSQRFASDLAVTALHIATLAEKRVGGVPGFVPKQSFRLRLPKTRRGVSRTHHICISDGSIETAAAAAAADAPDSAVPPDPSPQTLLQPSSQDAQSTEASAPSNSVAQHQNGESENRRCAPWFLCKSQALDADWMWYTSDRPILGFSGAL